MKKPIAVLISDIHFNIHTLNLASTALKLALIYAEEHSLPLCICGDLNDTKAIIRGEVANRLIELFEAHSAVNITILIGNHDLLNEKGEEHSLEFLKPYAAIVKSPVDDYTIGATLIPYQNSIEKFKKALEEKPMNGLILMHQGVLGAHMGEYVVDRTSISPDDLSSFTCISGHYHRHQTVGTVTYIGSPYTTSFAEANDGPKGFQLLHSDGSLEQVPIGLRKHVIREVSYESVADPIEDLKPQDLLWLKVSGPTSELDRLDKKKIGTALLGHQNFKLDKIYPDAPNNRIYIEKMKDNDILDKFIDELNTLPTQKAFLKTLWREILDETA